MGPQRRVFRRDLGELAEGYREVARRLGIFIDEKMLEQDAAEETVITFEESPAVKKARSHGKKGTPVKRARGARKKEE